MPTDGTSTHRKRHRRAQVTPQQPTNDSELDVLEDYFQRSLLPHLGAILREALDHIIRTEHTGRIILDQCEKVEKSYLGYLVEQLIATTLHLRQAPSGIDYLIVIDHTDHETDCKWTSRFGAWMIPPEAVGKICLLLYADDLTGEMACGLVRIDATLLTPGRTRDSKRRLSATGITHVRWLHKGTGLPPNFFLDMPEVERDTIFAASNGVEKALALFRSQHGRIVLRKNILALLGGHADPMRCVRKAKAQLAAEGLLILAGSSRTQRQIAKQLGGPVPAPGEWVCLRVDGTSAARVAAAEPVRRRETAKYTARLRHGKRRRSLPQ